MKYLQITFSKLVVIYFVFSCICGSVFPPELDTGGYQCQVQGLIQRRRLNQTRKEEEEAIISCREFTILKRKRHEESLKQRRALLPFLTNSRINFTSYREAGRQQTS